MQRLNEIMNHFMDVARTGDPVACAEPMSGAVEQVCGLRFNATFGSLSLIVDEPVIFGGSGSAPNPAETALAALGASMGVTLRCYAAYLGIPVDHVSVELRGALDNRGFFGTDPDVRPGFPEVEARVLVRTSASDEAVRRLIDRVEHCTPVLDLFRRATAVHVSVSRDTQP